MPAIQILKRPNEKILGMYNFLISVNEKIYLFSSSIEHYVLMVVEKIKTSCKATFNFSIHSSHRLSITGDGKSLPSDMSEIYPSNTERSLKN